MQSWNLTLKMGVILFALVLANCGPSSSNNDSFTPMSPKELVRKDVSELPTLRTSSVAHYDNANNRLFSAIFGGTTGIDVARYFSERIRHYFTEDELSDIRPARGGNQVKSDALKNSNKNKTTEQAGLELGAANIGAGLFLLGIINDRPLRIQVKDRIFTVTNPRIGMMQLGPGYKQTENVRGQAVVLPAIYRQSILIHEARHSDCAYGFSPEERAIWRTSKSMQETCEKIKDKSCSHFHTFCVGGQYEGLQACDGQAFGAYGVDLIFLKALRNGYSGFEQAIIDAMILETAGRLNFNPGEMLSGRMGRPNMTSTGAL